jgi:hypothetical protein
MLRAPVPFVTAPPTFCFATNPLETQRDGRGWTVEMAIPFSTLRSRRSSPDDRGVDFGRLVAGSREDA